MIRVALFTLVLMVHTVGSINWDPDHYRGMQFFTMLVHCARYGFVFVTGFVLFLAYYRSPITAGSFWRRRFGFVVAPYLAWSIIYPLTSYPFTGRPWPGSGEVAGDIGVAILQGNAKYQMYFLLISMQIYLTFPLVRLLLRRTEGRHGRVMAGAVVLNLAVFTLFSFYDPHLDWYGHMWKTLPTYALFLIGGALAAVHYERFAPWVRRNRRWLVPLSLAGAAFTIVMFFVSTTDGRMPGLAYAAWSVQNMPWYLGAVALFFIVGQAWDDRRGDGTGVFARIVDYGAVRAFGIFAVHPLVIDLIHQTDFVDWLYRTYPDTTLQRSILLVLATLVGSLCLVELILHTPLARILVARDMIRSAPRRRTAGDESEPAAGREARPRGDTSASEDVPESTPVESAVGAGEEHGPVRGRGGLPGCWRALFRRGRAHSGDRDDKDRARESAMSGMR